MEVQVGKGLRGGGKNWTSVSQFIVATLISNLHESVNADRSADKMLTGSADKEVGVAGEP